MLCYNIWFVKTSPERSEKLRDVNNCAIWLPLRVIYSELVEFVN